MNETKCVEVRDTLSEMKDCFCLGYIYNSWWCERIEVRKKRTRPQPLKRVGQKNGTEQCKNYDSPISLSDPQASITISGDLPPL